MRQLEPAPTYLLVKLLEKESTTASGIITGDTDKVKSDEAEVIAVGSGVSYKLHDTLFITGIGRDVPMNGKHYKLITLDSVLGKFTEVKS